MIAYTYNPALIEVIETKNEQDYTFRLLPKTEAMREQIKKIRTSFEENRDFTDAMFLTHDDGQFEVIVRPDSYVNFLTKAFALRCFESLSWK